MKNNPPNTINLSDLKSPKGHFILGNLKEFNKKNKHRILENWAKEYGELYTIRLASTKVLISANTEVNNNILRKRPDKFRRLSKIDEVFIEMGFHTVFNAEGEQWKKQRKPVAEALSVKKVKGYYPIIQEKTRALISKIDQYTDTNNPVEIINDFIAFAVDVTTEIAFGHKLNTIHNKEDSFQNHLGNIFPIINERITAPLPLWRFFPKAKDRQLKKSLKAIELIILNFINKAKQKLDDNPALKETPSTFLEALLVENEKEDTVFDEKTLYGNVIAMLVAGEDTTANTLSWIIFYLAQHPETIEKIRTESDLVFGNTIVADAYNNLASLKHTNAVIQEAIRLKPTTPLMFFQNNEDVVLGNITIPKDTVIIVQNGYAPMQENNFSNANTFDPNRWIKNECPYHHHASKTIKAFGGGPRLCPGMHLSIIEMTAVVSSICKRFDISLSTDPSNITENFSFTVHPENLNVVFKKHEVKK